jgi:uncharacterized membrane protein YkvA (DUF1232 family)
MNDNENLKWREISFDDEKKSIDYKADFNSRDGHIDANLWELVEKAGKKISLAKDILALIRYMRDPDVSWYRKTIVGAALIYFISPIDEIEDIAPLINNLENLGVIEALLKYLGSELTPYYNK